MSRVRRTGVFLALIAVAAFGATAITGAGAAKKTKTVAVGDNYFLPTELKVRKGDRVKWVWEGSNTHNVWATKAPSGVKKGKFRSDYVSTPGFTFVTRFRKRGRYKFICQLHTQEMRATIRVRR